jgi:beta-ribofuranosylaminobenzene 5'-phosphate synthase
LHGRGDGEATWRVRAPARLHLGFLDLHGGLGRRFGSLGLALDRPALELTASCASRLMVSGPEPERMRRAVEAAASHFGVPPLGRFAIMEAIPPHAGFGSGTQIALAAAAALTRLYGRVFDPAATAAALDRGNRSGVGLAAFTRGGLVLDGGRGLSDGRHLDDAPPPVVARLPFPNAWRVILVLHEGRTGVHGPAETRAFAALPPFPAAEAAHLCRLALMKILPAIATGDISAFGSGITVLQRRIGDHFAPVQGGRFTSPQVAAALDALETAGAAGIGQSSWGPTGFALAVSAAEAKRLVERVRASHPDLRFAIARGRNRGAAVSRLSEQTVPVKEAAA